MAFNPEPGGKTMQLGGSYQNAFAALLLARMLARESVNLQSFGVFGRIASVGVERSDKVDDVVVTYSRGRKQYIQVKTNISPTGDAWETLWKHFYDQYTLPDFLKDERPGPFRGERNGDLITLAVGLIGSANTKDVNNLLNRVAFKNSYHEWEDSLDTSQKNTLTKLKKLIGVSDDESFFDFARHLRFQLIPHDLGGEDSFQSAGNQMLRGLVKPVEGVFSELLRLVGEIAPRGGVLGYDELVAELQHTNPDISFPNLEQSIADRKHEIENLKQHSRILKQRITNLETYLGSLPDDKRARTKERQTTYQGECKDVEEKISVIEVSLELTPILQEPGLGPYVYLMCDRGPQYQQFQTTFLFNNSKRPRYPQIFIITGPDGENHNSLVRRFRYTLINDYVAAKIDLYKGDIRFEEIRDDWPSSMDLESRRFNLLFSLFKCFESKQALNREPEELTAIEFCKLLCTLSQPFVVIRHEIKVWDRETSELIKWYRDFWNQVKRAEEAPAILPSVLIFLNIVHRPGLIKKPKGKSSRDPITTALNRISDPPGRLIGSISRELNCTCVRLEPLPCVTREDVSRWFENYIKFGSIDAERTIDDIFRNGSETTETCKNMRVVENKLEKLYQSFVRTNHDG